MPNYQPASTSAVFAGEDGNRVVFVDLTTVAANLTTSDAVRMCRVPAGTKVDRVTIRNVDLDSGAGLAVNIGFAHIDGSSGASATAIASAVTTWQAAATTTYELFPPVELAKDSFLVAVPTVGGTGTGAVHGKVEGENMGVK